MNRIVASTALVAALACAGSAAAATPRAGKFTGATSQKYLMSLDVKDRRVAGGELPVQMNCEDGSTVERVVHVGSARVSRGGRFRIATTSGGNYGPEGKISVTTVLRGRFTSARSAQGMFVARATVSESTISPAVSCYGSGAWVGVR
jgi:hypothetical protein